MLTACSTNSSNSLKQSLRFPESLRRDVIRISRVGSSEFKQQFAPVNKCCWTVLNRQRWTFRESWTGKSQHQIHIFDITHLRGPSSSFVQRDICSCGIFLHGPLKEDSFRYTAVFWDSKQYISEESIQQLRTVNCATWNHEPLRRGRARLQQPQWGRQPQWQLDLGNKTYIT